MKPALTAEIAGPPGFPPGGLVECKRLPAPLRSAGYRVLTSVRRYVSILILALLLALPAAAQARRAPIQIGIGDQKTTMFKDPRFKQLGIRYARFSTPWDVMQVKGELKALTEWLTAARAAKVTPLITFDHSLIKRKHRVLPTVKQFTYNFTRLKRKFPFLHDFATWNEANYCGEITCHHPQRVAQYYNVIRKHCRRGCHVLAAELLDFPNMVSWARQFRRAAHFEPKIWGLHNYRDVNRLTTTNTRALLRATRGQIWMTETGGIVSRHNKSKVRFKQSAAHAAKATRWLFNRIITLSGRITRVYFYEWNARTYHDTWDSALIDPKGRIRPAFKVVQQYIRSHHRR